MIELKFSEIINQNKELENKLQSSPFRITILSNIIVHQIKEILEYSLREKGINANVKFGNYDNIVQDSHIHNQSNAVIIFWELCNVIEGLQYKIGVLDKNELDDILEMTKSEIDLVLKQFEKTSLVLINRFTSLPFSNYNIRKNNMEELAELLNSYLEEKSSPNLKLVDIDKIIASVSVDNSVDLRFFYSSKALYSIDFFKAYSLFVKPFFMSANGNAKKALIFDCDNTLWNGILGEDGFNNIEMSTSTNKGRIFAEIQSIALELNNQGILIGICSKNNPKDVDEVIEFHPDMLLRKEYIAVNKSNWSDKVTNLQNIAQELNIGLDSLVFIDDSSFEVNMIREKLPAVTALQVPGKLHEYPKMLREKKSLFYNLSSTIEDKTKIKMYKQQTKREASKKDFNDIEDYLSALELKLIIYEDDETIIPRMSQMSQKTNQFNLTTKRYTEADIKNFIDAPDYDVYAFSAIDKFGDNGITGLSIIAVKNKNKIAEAEIDTFLMSCRVIGRNIEYRFIYEILNSIHARGINKVRATYVPSEKNSQVESFYKNVGFYEKKGNKEHNEYVLDLLNYNPKKIDYIKVTYRNDI